MARIPYKQAADARGETKIKLEAAESNFVGLVAHAESVAPSLLGLISAMLTKLELPDGLRELVILCVGRRTGASYEWTQHVPIAESAGITAEQMEAIDRGALDAGCFGETEQAVLAFTAQVLENPRPDDAAFDRLKSKGLEVREVVELVLVVGSYQLLAHVMTAFDIDEDEPLSSSDFESMMDAIGDR